MANVARGSAGNAPLGTIPSVHRQASLEWRLEVRPPQRMQAKVCQRPETWIVFRMNDGALRNCQRIEAIRPGHDRTPSGRAAEALGGSPKGNAKRFSGLARTPLRAGVYTRPSPQVRFLAPNPLESQAPKLNRVSFGAAGSAFPSNGIAARRHCERSEAIHRREIGGRPERAASPNRGLLRFACKHGRFNMQKTARDPSAAGQA